MRHRCGGWSRSRPVLVLAAALVAALAVFVVPSTGAGADEPPAPWGECEFDGECR